MTQEFPYISHIVVYGENGGKGPSYQVTTKVSTASRCGGAEGVAAACAVARHAELAGWLVDGIAHAAGIWNHMVSERFITQLEW